MNNERIERVSPAATRATHRRVLAIDTDLVARKAADAALSDRRREIHAFHQSDADRLQRMLNAMQPSSYVRPHRHVSPPRAESLVVIQGALGFVAFDDLGEISDSDMILVSRQGSQIGIDCQPGVWHTFFALEPDTVLFEVKPGPFDALTDKEFASWAPDESDAGAREYLAQLEDRFRSRFRLSPRAWQP